MCIRDRDQVPMLPQKQQSIVTLVHGQKSWVSMVYVWSVSYTHLIRLPDAYSQDEAVHQVDENQDRLIIGQSSDVALHPYYRVAN